MQCLKRVAGDLLIDNCKLKPDIWQHVNSFLHVSGGFPRIYDLKAVYSLLYEVGWTVSGKQEDASEFITQLIKMSDVSLARQQSDALQMKPSTELEMVFGVVLHNTYMLLNGDVGSEHDVIEHQIPLSLKGEGDLDLLGILDGYTARNSIENFRGAPGYTRCTFACLPPVLMFQLLRFSNGGGDSVRKVKDVRHVSFGCRLDMSPYTTAVSGGAGHSCNNYELCAVLEHIARGEHTVDDEEQLCHYVAYVRAPHGDGWFRCDDANISSVSEAQVLCVQAYMLFYRQCSPSVRNVVGGVGGVQLKPMAMARGTVRASASLTSKVMSSQRLQSPGAKGVASGMVCAPAKDVRPESQWMVVGRKGRCSVVRDESEVAARSATNASAFSAPNACQTSKPAASAWPLQSRQLPTPRRPLPSSSEPSRQPPRAKGVASNAPGHLPEVAPGDAAVSLRLGARQTLMPHSPRKPPERSADSVMHFVVVEQVSVRSSLCFAPRSARAL